jgi:hypothetical protein
MSSESIEGPHHLVGAPHGRESWVMSEERSALLLIISCGAAVHGSCRFAGAQPWQKVGEHFTTDLRCHHLSYFLFQKPSFFNGARSVDCAHVSRSTCILLLSSRHSKSVRQTQTTLTVHTEL